MKSPPEIQIGPPRSTSHVALAIAAVAMVGIIFVVSLVVQRVS
jgi:hypothetical protein